MPIARIYRDSRVIRETTLTASDAEKFVILANAVRDAQHVMRNKPEWGSDGRSLKGVIHDDGVPYSERHPDDIYAVLGRLNELLSKHPRAEYAHLDQSVNGEVLRNTDGTPVRGLPLAHKNTPIPEPFHQATQLAVSATSLGMIPIDGLAFDRAELTDDGSVVPRAYVRWRA